MTMLKRLHIDNYKCLTNLTLPQAILISHHPEAIDQIFRLDSRRRDERSAGGALPRHRTLFNRWLIVNCRLDHHGVGAMYTALLSVVQALK